MAHLGLDDHAKARARCPWPQNHKHKDRNPSFGIFQNNGASWGWKCFVCGGGDEVAFLQQHFGLSAKDAICRYGELAGVDGNGGAMPAAKHATPEQPTPKGRTERDLGEQWRGCVEGFTDAHCQKLAEWRGYSMEFCQWLRERALVGLFNSKIAFPVHDDAGRIVGIHYRGKQDDEGRPPWFYEGGCKARPLLVGDVKTAGSVMAFESQWDAFAVMDKIGWHKAAPEAEAVIITRGSSNGALVAGLCAQDATLLAFKQNDGTEDARKAGKWFADVSAHAGCKVALVTTPEPHKDANDWTRAGATAEDIAKAVAAATVVSAGPAAEWPEPKTLPDDLPAVESFNYECLPGTLRGWLEDITERMQCPPDYPAVGALVALGSLIGRKVGIRPKRHDDWLLVPNLWGMVIGRPGLLKTPALDQALLPLNRLAAEAFKKYKVEAEAHEVDAMLDTQRAKLAEKKIKELLEGGKEASAQEAAKSSKGKTAKAPILRRYIVNDSTVEKLGELLNQNPNGMLLHRDELVGFLRSLDKEGHEDWRAFYLESWNGTGSFTYDRIGRGTVQIESNTMSIIGAIQPGPLSDYLRQAVRSGAGDDGLLQRLQVAVWPDTSKEWRDVDRWPDSKAKAEAFAVFEYLDTLNPAAVGAACPEGIPFLHFESDAQARFDQWRTKLERRLRSDGEHPAFEAHLSKYRKLVPTIALILHLANRDTGPVKLAAFEKALLWAGYLESHARRIYSAVLRPDAASARELAKHLKRGDLADKFTLRETYRKGWTGLGSKEDAEAATEILCELGWIRPVRHDSPAYGRPTSPTFEVNPKVRNSSDAN